MLSQIGRFLHDRQDFGIPRNGLVLRVNIELPEPFTESHMLFRRNLLFAKEDDLIVEKSLMDLGKGLIVQRLGQINAAYFRAACPRNRAHLYPCVFH